ncbi:RNA polymerase sigma-70 factor [Parapedobacter lycopersici]|uniref:RNA polymerase sigma factor n=1 Tax=Parapedobacter lycopersici TaxID=1864939 RepID=UPI003342873E
MSEPIHHNREDVLLHRLRAGDERAFDYFFHRFYPLILLFAARFLEHGDTAEEVVQDVFHKAWERRKDFPEVRSLKAFLYISAKNAALNQLSKSRNRSRNQDKYARLGTQVDQPVIEEIIRAEVYSSLSAAISTLPEQCQKIIRLIFEEGEKPADIAEQLNISISTINSQKARGLSLLRERLADKDLDLLMWAIVMSYPISDRFLG